MKKYLLELTILIIFSNLVFSQSGLATLKPGQISIKSGYYKDEFTTYILIDQGKYQYFTIGGRVGLLNCWDIGLTYELDKTKWKFEIANQVNRLNFDTKFQILNFSNTDFIPIITIGYGFAVNDYKINFSESIFVNRISANLTIPTKIISPYYSLVLALPTNGIEWFPKWIWEEKFTWLIKQHTLGVDINVLKTIKPYLEYRWVYRQENEFPDPNKTYEIGLIFLLDFRKQNITNTQTE